LDWFGSHSPYWLDTLVRCSGIHNFLSQRTFTPTEKLFLSNGLRFICTPPKTHAPSFAQHLLSDPTRGWQRFSRTLFHRLLHQESTAEKCESASARSHIFTKFLLPQPPRDTSQRESSLRTELSAELTALDQYRRSTHDRLSCFVNNPLIQHAVTMQKVNHSSGDAAFLRSLLGDRSVTIKPADKNLGLVLLDTCWYEAELHRMLSDRNTYAKFANTIMLNGREQKCSEQQLPGKLLQQLQVLAKRYFGVLLQWHPALAEQMNKFLQRRVTSSTATVPQIYLLIKVHKASGLCGRPIVPSTRWVTTPASILADHLLQEIVRETNIPWLVKDTKSLVVDLEQSPIEEKEGIFVTADIASLYTNIDTALGLHLVKEFLAERNVPQDRIELLLALLTFVMQNSYLSFKDCVYHQIDGTAMGTSVAPIYANIVVYMLERPVVREFGKDLRIYRRFLDDVFAFITRERAAEFQSRLNSLTPKLRFEFSSDPHEAAFLDLVIYKGERFAQSSIFDLRVHQKKMNLYLYIPFRSFHTTAAKRAFIQTELMRYIRNSSSIEAYVELKQIFYSRLRDRGYPAVFLQPLFNSIWYCDRPYFLSPAAALPQHPLLAACPPKSECLLRRLQRTQPTQSVSPPVLIVPYTPLSRIVPTRSILSQRWELLQTVFAACPLPRPIIAYQSLPSILALLVHAKAKRNEAERKKPQKPTATVQRSLLGFLQQPTVAPAEPVAGPTPRRASN
jgi:hypothetical protein